MDLIFNSIDDDYCLLLLDIKNNTLISTYAQSLKTYFDILSLSDRLVLMDSRRIVLPLPSVKPILKLLHASYLGISKTTSLARGLYFRSGMTNDIRQMVSSCVECSRVHAWTCSCESVRVQDSDKNNKKQTAPYFLICARIWTMHGAALRQHLNSRPSKC